MARPALESLEERWVPATIRLFGGNLFISNQTGPLTVTATATPGKFIVTDNGKSLTVSGVGSLISITGTNKADKITIDLNGNTFGGNVLINSGNGNDAVSIESESGGTIGGSVVVNLGRGNDSFLMGKESAIKIGGSMTLIGGLGNNKVDIANSLTSSFSSVGGNLQLIRFSNVTLGNAAIPPGNSSVSVGGDLVINNVTVAGKVNVNLYSPVTVNGNVNYSGGNGDHLIIGNAFVGGNATYRTGSGNDEFLISSFAGSSVGGSLNVFTGDGDDSISFAVGASDPLSIAGNLNLTMGNGNNSVSASSELSIGGNANLYSGNGDSILDLDNFIVSGNLTIILGNGDNVIFLGPDSSLAGRLNVLTGNGDNVLTLEGAQTYLAYVLFGNGDDELVLNNADLVLTGYVNGGGGSNTLTQTLGTLAPTLILVNF